MKIYGTFKKTSAIRKEKIAFEESGAPKKDGGDTLYTENNEERKVSNWAYLSILEKHKSFGQK